MKTPREDREPAPGALCCPRCACEVSVETLLEVQRADVPVTCPGCGETLRLSSLRQLIR